MVSYKTLSALFVIGAVLTGPAFAGEGVVPTPPPASAFTNTGTVVEGRNAAYVLPGVGANANAAIRQQEAGNFRSDTH